MAKHRKRKRGGARLLTPEIEVSLDIAALASADTVGTSTGSPTVRSYLISVLLTWSRRAGTDGEGPIRVGVCHPDYSDAEIEATIESNAGWDTGDLIAQELSRRFIRPVGTFSGAGTDQTLNDGKPIRTKCGWWLSPTQGLKVWAANRSGAVIAAGALILADGEALLRPVS